LLAPRPDVLLRLPAHCADLLLDLDQGLLDLGLGLTFGVEDELLGAGLGGLDPRGREELVDHEAGPDARHQGQGHEEPRHLSLPFRVRSWEAGSPLYGEPERRTQSMRHPGSGARHRSFRSATSIWSGYRSILVGQSVMKSSLSIAQCTASPGRVQRFEGRDGPDHVDAPRQSRGSLGWVCRARAAAMAETRGECPRRTRNETRRRWATSGGNPASMAARRAASSSALVESAPRSSSDRSAVVRSTPLAMSLDMTARRPDSRLAVSCSTTACSSRSS